MRTNIASNLVDKALGNIIDLGAEVLSEVPDHTDEYAERNRFKDVVDDIFEVLDSLERLYDKVVALEEDFPGAE